MKIRHSGWRIVSTYRYYRFPFKSKVGPDGNMAPPSRAKGGAMAPVPLPLRPPVRPITWVRRDQGVQVNSRASGIAASRSSLAPVSNPDCLRRHSTWSDTKKPLCNISITETGTALSWQLLASINIGPFTFKEYPGVARCWRQTLIWWTPSYRPQQEDAGSYVNRSTYFSAYQVSPILI